jgi:hypothetical protein
MPMPTVSDLHVDANLTNISIAYKNKFFVADDVFPLVPVKKRSDIIPKFRQSDWFRDVALEHASGTRAQRIGYSVSTSDTYFCHRYAAATEIGDEQRDNADQPWNLDQTATELVTNAVQLKRERKTAAAVFATSVWGTDYTGGTDFTAWSTYATSTPCLDVETWKDVVLAKSGQIPNAMVVGSQVMLKLKWHPDIIDAIKYTQKGIVSEDLIRSMFGLDYLLVGSAVYTASPDVSGGTTGAGTDQETLISYSRIWGKYALLYNRPAAPALMTPASGYNFVWQRVPNAIQYIQRFRQDQEEVDVIQANSYFAPTVTAANTALLSASVVA